MLKFRNIFRISSVMLIVILIISSVFILNIATTKKKGDVIEIWYSYEG